MSDATLVKRAVARKRHSYLNKRGKRVYAEVGDVIEVTAAQALAFSQNLVAPEVLEAQAIAAKAIKDAEMAARTAKNLAAQGLTKKEIDSLEDKEEKVPKEEEKEVRKSLEG